MSQTEQPENLDQFLETFENAEGVGKATARRLATEFGTVGDLLAAEDERIARTVGDPTNQADEAAIRVLKAVDQARETSQ